MIGRWYSRQQLANHYKRLSTLAIPEIAAPKSRTHPPHSFWSGELGSLLTRQFLIVLVSNVHGLKYLVAIYGLCLLTLTVLLFVILDQRDLPHFLII